MKACDVVTGLRAEVEQWRARAIRAEGVGREQIDAERRALLEAAAALVRRNAYNCTVADIVKDLEALRAQRTPTAGHEQIECRRAEIGRLRADLARVERERDDARADAMQARVLLAAERDVRRGAIATLSAALGEHPDAYPLRTLAERMAEALRAAREEVEAIRARLDLVRSAHAEAASDAAHNRRSLSEEMTMRYSAMTVLARALGVPPHSLTLGELASRAAARLTTVPAGGRAVSADLWERLSALADAVRAVPDAD